MTVNDYNIEEKREVRDDDIIALASFLLKPLQGANL